jgi:ArsR family transcriptional regulator
LLLTSAARTKTRNHKPSSANGVKDTNGHKAQVSDQTIHRFAEVFKIMADKSRLRILLALAQGGEMHVTSLCDMLDQSQPAVSHHLTLMRMTGIVGYRRDGKHNYYFLQSNAIRDMLLQYFSESGNNTRQLQFEEFALTFKSK